MKTFDVRCTIAAPPEAVWARWTDAPGLLAPLIGRSIPDLQPSFEQFAEGLRRLSEGGGR
ncbi:MAG: hypothetical protein R2745_08915 [Vicinamibacterales bacterium]